MYQMLAGAHPFKTRVGMDQYELARAIQEMPHKPLAEQGCKDARACALVDDLLRKAPYQRPRTPALLIRELKQIQGS
jgi:hypothetical protein